jgi:ArsR family transcriptional regulator
MNDSVENAATVFKALGNPVRLGILRRLAAEPETCACDFHEVFRLTQPTVSQHLKVLRDAQLVKTRRQGNKICYSVAPETLALVQELLGQLRPAAVSQPA